MTRENTDRFEYKFGLVKTDEVQPGWFKGIATTPKLDSYDDIIAAGAFRDSILTRGVTGPSGIKLLAQHNSDQPIGNWKTLEYVGDKLVVEGQLDLQDKNGKEYHQYLVTDKVGCLSVGFRTVERTYNEDTWVRTITKGDLREISIVTFPANEEAIILDVRSANVDKLSELEKKLAKDFSLSRRQISGIIRVIKSSNLLTSGVGVPAASTLTTEPIVKVDKAAEAITKMIDEITERANHHALDRILAQLS